MRQRVAWVDHAKGIGILLVVYGHVARGLDASPVGMPGVAFHAIDTIIYSFHMPLFFFQAGLVVKRSLESRGREGLVLSKLRSVAYPYLLWSILQGITAILLAPYTNHAGVDVTIARLLQIPVAPFAQFWFLLVLFHCFWIYAVLYRRVSETLLIILSLVAFSATEFIPSYVTRLVCAHFLFFVIGSLLPLDTLGARIPRGWAGVSILAIVFALWQWAAVRFEFGGGSIYALPGAVLGIALIVSLASTVEDKRWARALDILGQASMPIYLLHIFATAGTRILLYFVLDVSDQAIHLVAGLVAGIGVPLIVWQGARRWNWYWLFTLEPPNARPAQAPARSG